MRLVGLRHRGAGIDQDPHGQRAVAFGLADEVAVGARVKLPVDLAQLVARLVGAVLRELQAGAAAAAVVLAEAVAAGREARGELQRLQPGADFGGNDGVWMG
jgi:hypothetical protein